MSILQEVKEYKRELREQYRLNDLKLDHLIRSIESAEAGSADAAGSPSVSDNYDTIYPLSFNPSTFKGKKPTGVLFGEGSRVDVGTWKAVFQVILQRCIADPEKHVALMNLRGRISGRDRVLLARESDTMRSPIKIAENLYVEAHYDTETLFRIMTTRILDAVDYDYSGISVAVRNGR